MKTKVIALDIYGTVLSSEDYDNEMPVRNGFERFVERCRESGLKLITASDSHPKQMAIDLESAFENTPNSKLNLTIFEDFFQFLAPKDFRPVLEYFSIAPHELLVIGDSYEKDIKSAQELGCSTQFVLEYRNYDNFDFSKIRIP